MAGSLHLNHVSRRTLLYLGQAHQHLLGEIIERLGVGIVLAGTGVVSLALGAGFALAAHRSNDDLDKICVGNMCPVEAVDLVDQSHAQAARANIALGLGALALAGGAVVFFTAPTSRSPKTGRASASARHPSDGGWGLSTAIAPGAAALVAAGRF
jgi:hypothetical protein